MAGLVIALILALVGQAVVWEITRSWPDRRFAKAEMKKKLRVVSGGKR